MPQGTGSPPFDQTYTPTPSTPQLTPVPTTVTLTPFVPDHRKKILCCDGGGVRGLLTLHALKAFEESMGVKVHEYFDMFAGTSTGAIIAGGLASGLSVDELLTTYSEANMKSIFTPIRRDAKRILASLGISLTLMALLNAPVLAIGVLGLIASLGPLAFIGFAVAEATLWILLSDLVTLIFVKLVVPKYDNRNIKRILKKVFGEKRLVQGAKDIMITACDIVKNETTYFTCFHLPTQDTGAYRNLRFRSAIAASAGSAPIYFEPVSRFVDGGVGSYNNPSYRAVVEALRFSSQDLGGDQSGPDSQLKDLMLSLHRKYEPGKVVCYSFGTGTGISSPAGGEGEAKIAKAKGISMALDWIGWIINEYSQDAADEQVYVVNHEMDAMERAVAHRRYQINFNGEALKALKEMPGNMGLITQADIDALPGMELDLDSVKSFGFLERLGKAWGIWLKANCFADLKAHPPQPGDELVKSDTCTLGETRDPLGFPAYRDTVISTLEADNP